MDHSFGASFRINNLEQLYTNSQGKKKLKATIKLLLVFLSDFKRFKNYTL